MLLVGSCGLANVTEQMVEAQHVTYIGHEHVQLKLSQTSKRKHRRTDKIKMIRKLYLKHLSAKLFKGLII